MEITIVIILVVLAGAYSLRSVIKSLRGKSSCGCGSEKSSCPAVSDTVQRIRELSTDK